MADLLISHILDRIAELALAADPDSRTSLSALEGKRIRIHCTLPPVDVTLTVDEGQLRSLPDATEADHREPAHAMLRGNAADLLQLLTRGDLGSLQIEGDLALLQQFADIARNYRPTPIGAPSSGKHFDNLLGTAAEGLAMLRAAGNAAQQHAQSELRQRFTNSSDLDHWLAKQHQLQLRVDRLAARIDRLQQP